MPNATIQPPTPPSWLNQLPKSAVMRFDPADLLGCVLYVKGEKHSVGIAVAFMNIQSGFVAAKRQQRRIGRAHRILNRGLMGNTLIGLFADVHFYVICWTRIAKLARYVSDRLQFPRVHSVLKRYQRDLKAMSDARNHLEHFEERLPGGPKQKQLKQHKDLFNIAGNQMTFGGEQFGIGSESLAILKAFVNELNQAVIFDSLDFLAAADQQLIIRIVKDAQRDVALDQTLKRLGLPALNSHRRRLRQAKAEK